MIATRPLLPLVLLALSAQLAVARPAAPPDATAAPRNVVLMIPDGCGPAAVTLARRFARHPLALDSLLVGGVQTTSADSDVTDSAAGATAYATGVKTRNRTLGVDPDGRPLGTLVEAARTRGLATGIVTTADLTDATPAAFLVHVAKRALQDSIAALMLEGHADVMLGGDVSRWRPEGPEGRRDDGRDLLAEFRARGGTVVRTPEELERADRLPLLGLFGIGLGQISLEIDRDTLREPALDRMTAKALELLAPAPRGFFLVVEGGRIDDAGHDDDPGAMVREVLAYDRAVRRAVDFARRDGRTLVVSVADHETGGLGLGRRVGTTGPYLLYADSLRAARRSVWNMASDVLDGADPVAVAERGTGATLDDGERAALRDAAAAPDTLRRHALLRELSEVESRRARVGWSTGGHTGADVALHAFGPGSERFRGLHENTDVARLIAGLLGLDLDAETARLRGAARRR